jgi:tetratricopeptide (TPR) repeat protein
MSRFVVILLLAVALPAVSLAQDGPGPGAPPGTPPGGPSGPPVVGGPPGLPLWPPGARVVQGFELTGEELKPILEAEPGLAGVRSIRVIDYVLPGPPAPPDKILEFYAQALREPAWHAFFQKGGPDAKAAYRGPAGFISVLARPRGATVTHIEGEIELSDMPTLERVVREAVARRERVPLEARDKVDAALRLRQAGKIEEAVAELRTVVAAYPMADIAHFSLAKLLAEQRRFEEAGQHFRRAISLSPLNSVFRGEYAQFLADRGDLENAQYELQQATTIDPWSPPLYVALGHLLEKKGALPEAEQCYSRLVELVGNSPEAYIDLGRVLENEGKKKQALAAYRDALKLKSDFLPAQEGIRRLEK